MFITIYIFTQFGPEILGLLTVIKCRGWASHHSGHGLHDAEDHGGPGGAGLVVGAGSLSRSLATQAEAGFMEEKWGLEAEEKTLDRAELSCRRLSKVYFWESRFSQGSVNAELKLNMN